jgi:hypothetical protein
MALDSPRRGSMDSGVDGQDWGCPTGCSRRRQTGKNGSYDRSRPSIGQWAASHARPSLQASVGHKRQVASGPLAPPGYGRRHRGEQGPLPSDGERSHRSVPPTASRRHPGRHDDQTPAVSAHAPGIEVTPFPLPKRRDGLRWDLGNGPDHPTDSDRPTLPWTRRFLRRSGSEPRSCSSISSTGYADRPGQRSRWPRISGARQTLLSSTSELVNGRTQPTGRAEAGPSSYSTCRGPVDARCAWRTTWARPSGVRSRAGMQPATPSALSP